MLRPKGAGNVPTLIQLKGDPDFKRAFSTVSIETSDIQKLIDAWKIYLINVIWKECKELFSDYENLESQLKEAGLLLWKKVYWTILFTH